MERVLPNTIPVSKNGKALSYTPPSSAKFLSYTGLIPVLVEAMKEQQQQIEAMKGQQQQIKDLQAQIVELKKLIQK
jgi:hypothetical protein